MQIKYKKKCCQIPSNSIFLSYDFFPLNNSINTTLNINTIITINTIYNHFKF